MEPESIEYNIEKLDIIKYQATANGDNHIEKLIKLITLDC